MAVKMRLQRHGRKNYAYYHIVVAHSEAPRDGRYIERLGSYNPNTNPATVTLNFERALQWLDFGAQPTDTVRSILSHEGVLLMKHLKGGVKKGAFSEEEAQRRFDAWKADKVKGLEKIAKEQADKKVAAAKARLAEEEKINEAKAKAVAEKRQAKIEAEAQAIKEAAEAKAAEATAEETPAAE
ncbi:MAG: 30S ribosomal protein S16 [Paludibacteraceae bacterium]|nr:30S ribosomal protein S16 [Paludibacteraceae bacterium]